MLLETDLQAKFLIPMAISLGFDSLCNDNHVASSSLRLPHSRDLKRFCSNRLP